MRRFILVLLVCGSAVATALAGSSSAVTTNVTVHMTEYHFRLSQN
jgi:hypothetical protein